MADATTELNITPEEIESGKVMAIISYFIFFVPLLVEDARKNKFVMYHVQQSIVLLIAYVICTILTVVLIGLFLYILVFILWLIGLINAIQGKVKPVPIIGSLGEKFNLVK